MERGRPLWIIVATVSSTVSHPIVPKGFPEVILTLWTSECEGPARVENADPCGKSPTGSPD